MPDKEGAFSDVIKSFTEAQVTRFKEIFAAVAERVLRNGGDEDEANGIAMGIALSAARNYTPAPKSASLEEESHIFSIMAPEQLGRDSSGAIAGQQYSFDFLTANLDIAKAIAVGNTVNLEHDHSKPVGVITDVKLASEVEGISVDEDIPLVYVASYFKDTPDEVKNIESVSAEWAHFDINGQEEALPNTFAVTNTPLNGKVQGLKRLANIQVSEDKPYIDSAFKPKTRTIMSETETPANAAEFDAEKEVASLKASLGEEVEAREKAIEELNNFKASIASLTGKDDKAEEVTVTDLEASFKGLTKKVEASEKVVAEIKAAALDKEAEEFAASLVAEGKVASDATEKFAGLYKKLGKEEALDLAASLPQKHVGVSEGQAIASLSETEGEDVIKAALEAQRSKQMPEAN